ncbi:MAG: prepilin-type N-terminal cleavage/methylation domain-containing protein [Candidatus Magasanikbacteria bacterium]|nr:prepilin-type N-terminal cleavage/methylation domain-containing protein [Candidatus Magasanikbacteria bacterium]
MKKNNQGFTLLEILLVVAAIAILAGIVIVAINPGKQLADTRNAQRRIDVATILNAVYQYYIDAGNLPSELAVAEPGVAAELCVADTASATCTGASLVPLNELIWAERYLVDLPVDPNGTCATNGICYEITRTANNRVTVSAPDAEEGETISVTR